MAINLVTSIMQSLTPDMIAKIAALLGLDRGIAEKAIGAGIPAILASFANIASSPEGARQLSNSLAHQSPRALDQFSHAISGSNPAGLAESGTGLLSQLVGTGGLNALAAALGSFAGIGTATGKSLLGMLGPVVAGTLGQQQREGGLDASGLASLLTSQKDQIAAAMPPGFAKILSNIELLGPVDGGVRRTADTVSAARGQMAGMADDASHRAQAAYAASRSAAASSSWPYWALACLVAVLGVGWYFLSDRDDRQVAQQKAAPPTLASETTVGARTPNITAAELTMELNSSVNSVRAALQGMTNPDAARAALPRLQQAAARLDRINVLAAELPPAARQGVASSLAPTMTSLNQLFDKILATPEIASVAKPAIDVLRSKLDALTRA